MEYLAYSALSILFTVVVGWPIACLLLPRRLCGNAIAMGPLFGYAYIIYAADIFYHLNFAVPTPAFGFSYYFPSHP